MAKHDTGMHILQAILMYKHLSVRRTRALIVLNCYVCQPCFYNYLSSNGHFISMQRPPLRDMKVLNGILIPYNRSLLTPSIFFKSTKLNLCPWTCVPANVLNFINPLKLGPTKINDFTIVHDPKVCHDLEPSSVKLQYSKWSLWGICPIRHLLYFQMLQE